MDGRRRRVLRAVAVLSTSPLGGCTECDFGETNSDTGEDDPVNSTRKNASESKTHDIERFTAAATEFTRTVFEDEAYERAHERFTEQAQRLFQPIYFEQLQVGASAIGGEFLSIAGRADRSTSGTLTVTLDLSFRESPGQLVVGGEPDGFTRARLDGSYTKPAYVDTTGFETDERSLDVRECGLPATVAVPAIEDPVPGVVLVPGDGVIDRDFSTGGTAMYRDLAEGLASNGLATLRYEKRTFACDLSPSTTTLDREVTEDALSAIEELRTVDGVEADSIVLLGHSLGGLSAPRIAARDGELAGLVGLATPARPLQHLAITQTQHLADRLEFGHTLDSRLSRARSETKRVAAGEFEPDERLLGRTGSFWASLQSYDHLETAKALSIPQRYVQGGRDFQVDPEADFGRLQSRLAASDATFDCYPGLNHRCMPTNGPSVATEYRMPNNVRASFIADLADWIHEVSPPTDPRS
jgi:pimeloyl-ACP methyl ester carboxylesterase